MKQRIAILATALFALGLLGVSLAATAGAASRIYWGSDGALSLISHANLDGSGGGGDLSGAGSTPSNVTGLAISMAQGRVYWAGGKKVSFSNLDGSGGGDLATGSAPLSSPKGVAVDPVSGRIYWANSSTPGIAFANLSGGGGGSLNTAGATLSSPIGVTVDAAAGRIYWSNAGAADKISYANLDGSGGGDINTGSATVDNPQGVAVDPQSGRIYWSNVYGQKISYANLDGSGGGDLNTGSATVSNPAGVAIDAAAGRIYWANATGQKISYANLDGSGGGDLATTGATVNYPDDPVLIESPVTGGEAPAVTARGRSLTCSNGTWALGNIPSFLYRSPSSFAYQWSRNGIAIPGAIASTYTPAGPHTAAGAGEYSCTVTAINPAGSASETSDPHTIPLLPAPVLGGLAIGPHAFIAAGMGSGAKASASKSHPRPGTKVTFSLDQAAAVAFAVERRLTGKRGPAGTCHRSKTTVHGKLKCSLLVPLPNGFSRAADAGPNSFRYDGRLGPKKLPPGNYLLVATPAIEAVSGQAASAGFRIKPPPARR